MGRFRVDSLPARAKGRGRPTHVVQTTEKTSTGRLCRWLYVRTDSPHRGDELLQFVTATSISRRRSQRRHQPRFAVPGSALPTTPGPSTGYGVTDVAVSAPTEGDTAAESDCGGEPSGDSVREHVEDAHTDPVVSRPMTIAKRNSEPEVPCIRDDAIAGTTTKDVERESTRVHERQ